MRWAGGRAGNRAGAGGWAEGWAGGWRECVGVGDMGVGQIASKRFLYAPPPGGTKFACEGVVGQREPTNIQNQGPPPAPAQFLTRPCRECLAAIWFVIQAAGEPRCLEGVAEI